MNEREPFKCSKCGACCRMIFFAIDQANKEHNKDDPIAELIRSFPYKVRADGSCSMLGDDGLCTVYEHRPLICNVDGMYEMFYAGKITKKEFNRVTHQSCDMLREVIINNTK